MQHYSAATSPGKCTQKWHAIGPSLTFGQLFRLALYFQYARPAFSIGFSVRPPPATWPTVARHSLDTTCADGSKRKGVIIHQQTVPSEGLRKAMVILLSRSHLSSRLWESNSYACMLVEPSTADVDFDELTDNQAYTLALETASSACTSGVAFVNLSAAGVPFINARNDDVTSQSQP